MTIGTQNGQIIQFGIGTLHQRFNGLIMVRFNKTLSAWTLLILKVKRAGFTA